MRCYEAKNLISRYLDNELESKLRIKTEEHLSSCSTCKKELQSLQRISLFLHSYEDISISEDFISKTMLQLYNKSFRSKKQTNFFLKIALNFIFIILFTVSLFSGLSMSLDFFHNNDDISNYFASESLLTFLELENE